MIYVIFENLQLFNRYSIQLLENSKSFKSYCMGFKYIEKT